LSVTGLRYHQGGKIQKAKEKLPTRPASLLLNSLQRLKHLQRLQVCILTLIPFSPFLKGTNSLNRKSN